MAQSRVAKGDKRLQCRYCHTPFEPRRPWQIFHTKECRDAWWKEQYQAFKASREEAGDRDEV